MDAHCGGQSRSSSSEPGGGSGILDPWHHTGFLLLAEATAEEETKQMRGDEADEQQHHRLMLQLHQQVQEQEPPSVPVFHLQAMRQSTEYALLAPMGDDGQSHSLHHGGGFQPQLLSFGGVDRQPHQFTAQASRAEAGGEIVAAATSHSSRVTTSIAGGGEIVPAVQAGGHTVRSTGRKDQHSKVCTARGARDRRVRLSAHTAIQFYDVQDRLGYDRPSKAVDWLISNAKDAIDKLHHTLPAWHPAASANPSSTHPAADDNNSDDQAITVAHPGSFDFPGSTAAGGGFLPASLDSDSIVANTIKSFFPMGGTGGGEASSSSGFQSYTPDLLSRTGSHSQELRLSLPDPPMFQHHHSQQQQEHGGGNGSALFPGYSFGATWPEPAQQQRMVPWTVPDPGGGYLFNVPQQLAGGRRQFLFPRGPLQSSNNPPSDHRGCPDTVEADNHPMFGFRIPTRMQGDEDHDGGGNGDKPLVSSASSHH
jgi:hypothetical protein